MAEEFEKPQYSEQEQIRRAKLAKYCEEGRDPYTITRFDRTHTSTEILNNFDALEGKNVRIAGRMMSRRIMGKASFVHMMDGDGQIQAYVRREDVGEDVYADFKTMDIGDILGIEGVVFRTKTGEVSVHANAPDAAEQVSARAAGEVERSARPGYALSSALCRYHCQSGGQGHVHQAQPDSQGIA